MIRWFEEYICECEEPSGLRTLGPFFALAQTSDTVSEIIEDSGIIIPDVGQFKCFRKFFYFRNNILHLHKLIL